jgi:hypothetical protein
MVFGNRLRIIAAVAAAVAALGAGILTTGPAIAAQGSAPVHAKLITTSPDGISGGG